MLHIYRDGEDKKIGQPQVRSVQVLHDNFPVRQDFSQVAGLLQVRALDRHGIAVRLKRKESIETLAASVILQAEYRIRNNFYLGAVCGALCGGVRDGNRNREGV